MWWYSSVSFLEGCMIFQSDDVLHVLGFSKVGVSKAEDVFKVGEELVDLLLDFRGFFFHF